MSYPEGYCVEWTVSAAGLYPGVLREGEILPVSRRAARGENRRECRICNSLVGILRGLSVSLQQSLLAPL